jgi:uncharacterized OsmC-like protein
VTVPGIDVAILEGFNKEYDASPESFELGVNARTLWEGRGLGNLARIGPWSLGGQTIEKPARDFSVQLGSWQEVGDAIGVNGADDRIEPIEGALAAVASCVTEAVALNCARTGVDLKGLEVRAHLDVDPGPITGARDPSEWDKNPRKVQVDVNATGRFSDEDKAMIEEGATRSPVHNLFSRAGMETNFHYN